MVGTSFKRTKFQNIHVTIDQFRRSNTEVFCNFNCNFEKCYAQCIKIYKSLLQLWYTKIQLIVYKTTQQQPSTTHLNSV